MIKPSYRTDAMSQTAFSPHLGFLFILSKCSAFSLFPPLHPKACALSGRPPSKHTPCQFFSLLLLVVVVVLMLSPGGALNANKTPIKFHIPPCAAGKKVSLNETHTGWAPSVIMLRTCSEKREAVPVPVTSLFFFSRQRQKSLLRVRGEVKERPEERKSEEPSYTAPGGGGSIPVPAHQLLPHIQLIFPVAHEEYTLVLTRAQTRTHALPIQSRELFRHISPFCLAHSSGRAQRQITVRITHEGGGRGRASVTAFCLSDIPHPALEYQRYINQQ